jgi:hypothetical protein
VQGLEIFIKKVNNEKKKKIELKIKKKIKYPRLEDGKHPDKKKNMNI